jgi:hypothetical protein
MVVDGVGAAIDDGDVVAIGATRPGIEELACDVSVPAKKYASPLVVAQLASSETMRALRDGWRRRIRVPACGGVRGATIGNPRA